MIVKLLFGVINQNSEIDRIQEQQFFTLKVIGHLPDSRSVADVRYKDVIVLLVNSFITCGARPSFFRPSIHLLIEWPPSLP